MNKYWKSVFDLADEMTKGYLPEYEYVTNPVTGHTERVIKPAKYFTLEEREVDE